MISYKYMRDNVTALEMFGHLISDYPDNKYARNAKSIYGKIEREQRRKAKTKKRKSGRR